MRAERLLLVALTVAAACGGEDTGAGETEASAVERPAGVYGVAPAAVRGVPSLVTLTPAGGVAGAEGNVETDGVIDQFGLMFSPARLIVAAGSTLRLTNSESALTHNVHVRSVVGDSTILNTDAATGESVRVVLADEGAYDVLCDMHPGMSAIVYATPAPWASFAGPDGAFAIVGVPAGTYDVGLWTADRGPRVVRTVTVGEGVTEVRLTESG